MALKLEGMTKTAISRETKLSKKRVTKILLELAEDKRQVLEQRREKVLALTKQGRSLTYISKALKETVDKVRNDQEYLGVYAPKYQTQIVAQRRAKVLRLNAKGLGVTEISTRLKLLLETVKNDFAALGIFSPAFEDKETIQARRTKVYRLKDSGLRATEIAKELGVRIGQVRNDLLVRPNQTTSK